MKVKKTIGDFAIDALFNTFKFLQTSGIVSNKIQRDLLNLLARRLPTPSGVNTESFDLQGQELLIVSPSESIAKVKQSSKALLWFHGGGYHIGSPYTHLRMVAELARLSEVKAYIPDYRLAPEHPFPGALEDSINAYRHLLSLGYKAHDIVVGGDSAGGGLTMALLLSLKQSNEPMPAGAVLLSPWVDLTASSKSCYEKAPDDPMLSREMGLNWAKSYLQGKDPKSPYASPLFADDVSGLPTILIHVGTREILYDDAQLLHEKLKKSGTVSMLKVWQGMPHVFQLFSGVIPQANEAITEIASFIQQRFLLK